MKKTYNITIAVERHIYDTFEMNGIEADTKEEAQSLALERFDCREHDWNNYASSAPVITVASWISQTELANIAAKASELEKQRNDLLERAKDIQNEINKLQRH
ncbi:hypothetical protein AWB71_05293 [Caballeronia peredens]|nr:hypothetical protein AWB71_05293 [Caballeronia peredens]